MKFATGKDDPALAETVWPLPDYGDEDLNSIEWQLRYGQPDRHAMIGAAEIVASYHALIEDGTTVEQTKRMAALRRVYRRTK